MKTPFVYGRIATAGDFTDRKQETEKLILYFTSSINSILISPGRWGKSSLAVYAAEAVIRKKRRIRFCFADMTNVRSEEEFFRNFAAAVLQGSSKKARELTEMADRFLGRFNPDIAASPGQNTEFRLELNLREVKKNPDDILDLAEKIATEKKIKFVVCIDQFQNTAGFEDPVEFQKKLKVHWQKHNMVCYCLCGSRRQFMMDVFGSPSMPLYKFGDIIHLQKISIEEWIPFIRKRFADTGKIIESKVARKIAEYAGCHSYYVQQLAQQCWLRTRSRCNIAIVETAFSNLVLQLSMLFRNLADGLSDTQVNFLRAVVNDVGQLSSQEAIIEYRLGTSGNIMKIKRALMSKEIIDIEAGKVIILDPLFRVWLKDHYFRNR